MNDVRMRLSDNAHVVVTLRCFKPLYNRADIKIAILGSCDFYHVTFLKQSRNKIV